MQGPEDDLSLLLAAASEAGEIAMRYWRNEPRFWDKGDDQGPVSEADLEVNRHLEARLRAARPDYGWLSEESADDASRLDAKRVFIIDPIDGTRAFLDGQEGFSHSLAIAEGERIIAGVVHLPARAVTYAASAHGPATRNGQPITPKEAEIAAATVLANKPTLNPALWRDGILPPFRREFRPSLAWRLCLAAEGAFNAAVSLRGAWEWDIAAGSLIAERAGCIVSDRRGRAMGFNSAGAKLDGLVIAPPQLHAQIMARLAD